MSAPTPTSPRDQRLPPHAWPSVHAFARRVVSPIQRILTIEAASGLILLAAAVAALAWASSPWRDSYRALWETPLGVRVGDHVFARPLQFWIDDVLMTVFFFVVGLEIRREIHAGELSTPRRAVLPLVAAIGGMLAPAAVYAALNAGRAGAAGWGIPMATDIAFAVGVVTVLGRRVAPPLRVLLLALAVIDDIGAIVVIAIFYSGGLAPSWFAVAVGAWLAVLLLRIAGVRRTGAYLIPAIALWIGLYAAGIHPTLAGVVLGLSTPVRPWLVPEGTAPRDPRSPAEYLQEALHPWVAFVIMPVFALANAGVTLDGASLSGDGLLVFVGVVLGLVVGKPLGVFLFTRAAIGARVAVRPGGVSDHALAVVGMVAGIGFTMSLFIAALAFPPGPLLATAKLGIIVGSGAAIAVSATAGAIMLPRRE